MWYISHCLSSFNVCVLAVFGYSKMEKPLKCRATKNEVIIKL